MEKVLYLLFCMIFVCAGCVKHDGKKKTATNREIILSVGGQEIVPLTDIVNGEEFKKGLAGLTIVSSDPTITTAEIQGVNLVVKGHAGGIESVGLSRNGKVISKNMSVIVGPLKFHKTDKISNGGVEIETDSSGEVDLSGLPGLPDRVIIPVVVRMNQEDFAQPINNPFLAIFGKDTFGAGQDLFQIVLLNQLNLAKPSPFFGGKIVLPLESGKVVSMLIYGSGDPTKPLDDAIQSPDLRMDKDSKFDVDAIKVHLVNKFLQGLHPTTSSISLGNTGYFADEAIDRDKGMLLFVHQQW
ncbi:MAG: hypothetical protein Greene041636_982 [Parcubacteria group bacterium Greene0416_36]|nr:MAG: hypothetical protein Greene041636_982 [Parcubacteria group bacterium Greene0416_36]